MRSDQFFLIIAIFAAIGFLLFLGHIINVIRGFNHGRKQYDASRTWPTTKGQILKSEVNTDHDYGPEGHGITTYDPVIKFHYKAFGQDYESDRISFGFKRSYIDRSDAEQVIQKYPKDAAVTVYYDPDKPAEAVLERKIGSKTWD